VESLKLYICICSEKYGPEGRYIHHYPHFDKPHNYHQPGFRATLAMYKKVSYVNEMENVFWLEL
jgi:hypothetical protein